MGTLLHRAALTTLLAAYAMLSPRATAADNALEWFAGIASVKITPEKPVRWRDTRSGQAV